MGKTDASKVAAKHYLQVTDDDFGKAIAPTPETVRKPVPSGQDSGRTASHQEIEECCFSGECKEKRPHAKACDRSRWAILDSNQNSEQPNTTTTYVDSISDESSNGAKTGAVGAGDPRLEMIIDSWPNLTEETRNAIADQALDRCTS